MSRTPATVACMSRPIIGVTTYREHAAWGVWSQAADLIGVTYTDAVAEAGGVPVLLPPLPDGVLGALPALDGLVLTGGGDVDPGLYGATPHPATDPPQPERDRAEIALLRACLESGTPLLAICRGLQVLNVALGGTLHQHLPDVPGAGPHRGPAGVFHHHHVRVASPSRLASLVGPALDAHCYHHQAIDRLGPGVRAVAWSEDGIVEAVELAGAPGFVLGVQSHPEASDDRRLFAGLVTAAGKGLVDTIREG